MAKSKAPKLPTPTQAMPSILPKTRSGTYAAVTRSADRYLARAEEAVRMAALLWADVDSGLEARMEELAQELFDVRKESVETVADLYGDGLNEGVF